MLILRDKNHDIDINNNWLTDFFYEKNKKSRQWPQTSQNRHMKGIWFEFLKVWL